MKPNIKKIAALLSAVAAFGLVAGSFGGAVAPAPAADASSHREAPNISRDPQADGTDVYAFISPDKPDTVTLIANYYPFQAPYGGPNFYQFGDDVRYRINIDNNGDAREDITFEWGFRTHINNTKTFLYNTGPITSLTDPDFNIRQKYDLWVTREASKVAAVEYDDEGSVVQGIVRKQIGKDLLVPPVNVGPKSTPNYDSLANAAIYPLEGGIKAFAGQRDDPFFVDLGAIFDLLTIRKLPGDTGGGVDGLEGFNVMTLALQVPIELLTANGKKPVDANDPNAVIGVWSQSLRQHINIKGEGSGIWLPVSRLGMPLVNEVVIPLAQKNRFNSSSPHQDAQFLSNVTDPELARLLKALYGIQVPPTPRDDLVAIFLTGLDGLNKPAGVTPSEQLRLNMAVPPTATPNPLGVVAGDNQGFPNGRRLADDVTDVALKAVAGAVYPLFHPGFVPDPLAGRLGDGVDANDKPFLPTFPYVASPWSGIN